MNTFQRIAYPLVTVLSVAAAVSAHAEGPLPDQGVQQSWTSTQTRAQVQAELFQARADGSIKVYSTSYNPLTAAKTTLTREEVKAQARVELASNPAAQMLGEDSGSFYLAQHPAAQDSSRTLAKVSR